MAFIVQLNLTQNDDTFEHRINRLKSEILSLISGDQKKALSFNKDYTYGDLKKILEKLS